MIVTKAARQILTTEDRVYVVDWAETGDLFYGEMSEDGERPVLRPDHEARVMLEINGGELWLLPRSFGIDFWGAEEMACRIANTGSVNLDLWQYHRTVYGSEAYQHNGIEMERASAEREEARWESVR